MYVHCTINYYFMTALVASCYYPIEGEEVTAETTNCLRKAAGGILPLRLQWVLTSVLIFGTSNPLTPLSPSFSSALMLPLGGA